jgi:hypothetical protein
LVLPYRIFERGVLSSILTSYGGNIASFKFADWIWNTKEICDLPINHIKIADLRFAD